MGFALAHLELAFLCLLTLALAMQPALPVPRALAGAGAALVCAQTAAIRTMRIEPFEPAKRVTAWESLDSVAEVTALIAVPALTAVLLTVVFWHLARANARTRHRLRDARAGDRRGGDAPQSEPAGP